MSALTPTHLCPDGDCSADPVLQLALHLGLLPRLGDLVLDTLAQSGDQREEVWVRAYSEVWLLLSS